MQQEIREKVEKVGRGLTLAGLVLAAATTVSYIPDLIYNNAGTWDEDLGSGDMRSNGVVSRILAVNRMYGCHDHEYNREELICEPKPTLVDMLQPLREVDGRMIFVEVSDDTLRGKIASNIGPFVEFLSGMGLMLSGIALWGSSVKKEEY